MLLINCSVSACRSKLRQQIRLKSDLMSQVHTLQAVIQQLEEEVCEARKMYCEIAAVSNTIIALSSYFRNLRAFDVHATYVTQQAIYII